jgi:D-alanyl-D-alanine carboxypeptidase
MRLFFRTAAVLLLLATAPAFGAQSPAHIVVDLGAGTVIAHKDAAKLWHPASVTKLMTAYVTFKAMKAGAITSETRVVVSQHALNEPPSKMGYKVGTDMTLDNALKMMIVRSANDIAMAIAETVGGSESGFVAKMNEEARRLGMASTVFRNPNGLPNEAQVTTARDLAVLTRAIWVEFPEYREFFKIPAIKAGKKILRSHNTLLERFRGANGMKTGFICASGFNMVATATRSGKTLAVVVLGSDSSKDRAELAAKLLQDGFRPKLLGGNRPALAGFRSTRAPGPPVNLKEQICGKRKKQEGENEPQLAGAFNRSALEPRFVLMAPVPVTTGIAAKKDGGKKPGGGIPIPRPRPPMPGDSAMTDPLVDEVARALKQPDSPASPQSLQ